MRSAMTSLYVTEDKKNHTVTIAIKDRFDFAVHKEFRASYRDRTLPARYVVDLRQVNYIDSSALGMLLLLREHALAHRGQVVIANCSSDVRQILTIANFDRLLQIQ